MIDLAFVLVREPTNRTNYLWKSVSTSLLPPKMMTVCPS